MNLNELQWFTKSPPNDTRALDVYDASGWKLHHGVWGRNNEARLIAASPRLAEFAVSSYLNGDMSSFRLAELAKLLAEAGVG